jgi:hypothetical protein
LKIIKPDEFFVRVEDMVWEKDCTHTEAVLFLCEELSIEALDIKKFVNAALLVILEAEAKTMNLLRKES